MKIITFISTRLDTNTYIVYDEKTLRGFIVDPGGQGGKIEEIIKKNNLNIEGILLTHGHFDHTNACGYLQKLGYKVYGSFIEETYTKYNMEMARLLLIPYNKFKMDIDIYDGEVLDIAGMSILVMFTPGHSKGSVCFIVNDCIFAGDTVFRESYGKISFKGGSMSEMKKSFRKLFALEGNYTIYSGHGYSTTLDYERKNNWINHEL